MLKRLAIALIVVVMLVPFVGTASAEPPYPWPVIQVVWMPGGEPFFCVAWTGQVIDSGMGWYWAPQRVYLPTCPIGAEMFDLSDSVQGRFVANTQVLAEPDATSGIDVVMEVGKTVWVHGVDPTGSFFQFSIGAVKAWVPVSSLEPNYEAPWNGAPLVVPVID